jgi:hypothetical protein
MRKIYPFSLLLLSFSFSFAQQPETNRTISGNPLLSTEGLIPVQKGDSFFVRPTIPSSQKKPLLTNLLRGLGLASAAYGVSHAAESSGKKITSGKTNIFPEAGLALFIGAPKISKAISPDKTYLQYFLYDKNMNLVSTSIIPISKKAIKKEMDICPERA